MSSKGDSGTQASSQSAVDSTGWSASLYNKTASFVYSQGYTANVLNLLAAQPGERILDIGCGSGELTLDLQNVVEQATGGLVVGTDSSESMVNKAKANGVKHAFIADAQDLELPEGIQGLTDKFDAVFSNATLHWCKRNPRGVLDSARKVLRPGGRFVAEMGGHLNCVGVRSALHSALRSRGINAAELDPWYFPSVEEYQELLSAAGFETTHLSLTPRLTPLPSGLYEWLILFVRNSFLKGLDEAEAESIMREVEERCRVDCQEANGKWTMMYVRLRFAARLK